ncbi:hypothetical protein [Pseudarthrobacter sp. BIM B-2242]|uniref:hypothetical protein n=1 Tax=Pseudarthrobacter sp. BIM B-2242 TaxID=2772401 RepID=UPI00168BB3A6|nr:hypothetical protein [Pseudarthrobacter sp. BIM B-2242]QOD05685.1 hypothetical protein IDT60_21825 [Pseudarthrobacter sp. BIM B-2242]
MSTIINHGFRLAEGTDLDSFTQTVRDVIDPLRDQEDLKLVAIETAKYIDSQWLAGDPILPGAAAAAYAQWAEAQAKMSVYDHDRDLNRFELSIGTDPGTGRTMVIARAENHVLMDAFEDLGGVEEYGYWDHTNSYPEGVTEADWKERKEAWTRTLPGVKVSDTMASWFLRDTLEIREELRDVHAILPHIPEAADRARSAGLDAYGNYLFQEQGVEVMKAVRFVVFARGVSVRPVIDTVASYLPALTAELLTEGSGGATLNPGYKDAVAAACAALYEQDKDALAEDH